MNILLSCSKEDINNLTNILSVIKNIRLIIPLLIILFSIIYIIFKLISNKNSNISYQLLIINIIVSLVAFFSLNIIFFINIFIKSDNIACLEAIYNNNVIEDKEVDIENDNSNNDNEEIIDKDDEIIKIDEKEETIEPVDLVGKINELIPNFKSTLDIGIYNEIRELYDKITLQEERDSINSIINDIEKYVNIINDINVLSSNYDRTKYNEIYKVISELTDNDIKEKLKNKLLLSRNFPKLNVKSGVISNENSKILPHVLSIPDNPTENMPLIVYLHGDWGGGILKQLVEFDTYIYEKIQKKVQEPFLFLSPTANGYSAKYYNWEDVNLIKKVKSLIDSVVSEYKIDTSRIIVMGHSRGAVGTWHIASKYPNFFSIAIPVSCSGAGFKASSFKNTKVLAFVGGIDRESVYAGAMKKYVNSIREIGGEAKLIQYPEKAHAEMGGILRFIDLYKWILEQ